MAPVLYRLLVLPLFITGNLLFAPAYEKAHPYYVSVTEIRYSQPDKEIQVSCKIFTDDLEYALKGMYHTKADLYHPPDKALLNRQIAGYIGKHFRVKADNSLVALHFIGYEIEGEAAWCYLSAGDIPPVKNIEVFNDLLYEYKKEQVNITHVSVGGDRKSARLTSPHTGAVFSF